MALRYFDRNGTTAGFGTLTGAWDTTTASWSDSAVGTATPAAYTFTDADEAQFGATGATATGGTATIAAALNVTLNKVRTQNLAAGQTIAAGASGTMTLAGTAPAIDVQSAGGLLISAPLAGASGFSKLGTGILALSGASSISGAVSVDGILRIGLTLAAANAVTTPDMLQSITSYVLGSSASLVYGGSSAYTEDAPITGAASSFVGTLNQSGITFIDISGYAGTIYVQAFNAYTSPATTSGRAKLQHLPANLASLTYVYSVLGTTAYNPTIVLEPTQASTSSCGIDFSTAALGTVDVTATLQSDGAAGIATTIAGNVVRTGAATTRSIVFVLTGSNDVSALTGNLTVPSVILQKQGTGKWALSGTNTYTGTTTISAGTLSAQSASALGRDSSLSGGAISVTGGTLELAGGITLDKSGLNISTVTTASPTNAFQVPASGGDNTLEVGSITLNSTIRTEVGSGGVLRLANTGAISGSTFGITKEGAGELDLNAASNTFTGAVAVNAGTLTVSASCAPSTNGPLGNASSAVVVTGTLKFDGASNSDISRSVQLAGSAPALDASGTHRVHFHNVSQASGTRTLTLRGTSTNANQLQSALGNGSGGTTGLTKDGAGKWSVTGTPSYTGLTTVNAGTLDFGGQDLTLTGDVTMAGGVLANGTLDNTLVTDVTFTGGTVQALLDGASTVTASSGTGRLYPVTSDGSNTYTGTTTVQAGATLDLVTDSNPGTVGYGKVTGAGNVTVSGTLATGSGGNQRGQCRYGGNLTFAAGSVLAIGAAA